MKLSTKKAAFLAGRVKNFFTQQPLLVSGLQLSSGFLSGIRISPKVGKIRHYFLFPLEKEVIQPSFFKKNIKNGDLLGEKMKEGVQKLQLSDHRVVFLLPELSQKAFIFSFDSLPPSQQERERIIRFRIKKQLPLLPDDARLSFDLIQSNDKARIIASIARASVIKEFEDFFSQFRLKIRIVGVPFLSLSNLIKKETEGDVMLVNIEEDCFSLAVVLNSEIFLYRQKPFDIGSQYRAPFEKKVENIIQEIEKTANFIEDKEEKKISTIWIRMALVESSEKASAILAEKLRFPVKGIESSLALNLTMEETNIISPLLGQLI